MTEVPSSSRVWFVTGASRGLGRAFVDVALGAGDRVVALSRSATPGDGGDDHPVSQAVAPVLRAQGSGRLLQVSSVGGLLAFPTTGLYGASKFAVEGMSEALAAELAPFGVRVTIVEPGGYWTDLYRAMRTTDPLPAYAAARAELAAHWAGDSVDSDPRLAAAAVLAVVDSDDPPLRLVLGGTVLDAAVAAHHARIRVWESWETVSRAAEQAIPEAAVRRAARAG